MGSLGAWAGGLERGLAGARGKLWAGAEVASESSLARGISSRVCLLNEIGVMALGPSLPLSLAPGVLVSFPARG